MAFVATQAGDRTGPRPGETPVDGTRLRAAGRPVVMFVEDQPTVRFTVAARLKEAGYDVVEVASGEEALAMLRGSAKVDALLTDLRLPGAIDGWDIAEAARQLRAGLPVIYASAYSYVTPRQVPGSLMLDKPYSAEALLDALDTLLD
jgi:CheY-like chemotaxis protein